MVQDAGEVPTPHVAGGVTKLQRHHEGSLHLDVDDDAIRQVRAALLEILQCSCFVVDTPEGRITN